MNDYSLKSLVRHFAVPLMLLIIANAGVLTTSHAQSVNLQRLNQNYNTEAARGSRLKRAEDRRCKSCEEEQARNKIKYLMRVLAEDNSNAYQKTIESIIFTDAKFVKRCWKNAIKKDMEFFSRLTSRVAPMTSSGFPNTARVNASNDISPNLSFLLWKNRTTPGWLCQSWRGE